jgi:hypothetical protein
MKITDQQLIDEHEIGRIVYQTLKHTGFSGFSGFSGLPL